MQNPRERKNFVMKVRMKICPGKATLRIAAETEAGEKELLEKLNKNRGQLALKN